jgi:glycosyltransferase involved in cell wall biosynthesis
VTALAPPETDGVPARLAELGISFEPIMLRRLGLDPIGDLRSTLSMVRALRRIRPDVVFTYTVKPVIFGTLAATLAGIRRRYAMITGLGYPFGNETAKQRWVGRAVRWLYRLALPRNEVLFFQNPDDQAELVRARIVEAERTVRVNGSGVDLDRFQLQPPVTEPVRFLLMSRLIREKGLAVFAQAASRLRERFPAAEFLILGSFDPGPAGIPPEEIQTWASKGWVRYLGKTEDVRPYIAEASVVVLPSYREGTPHSVLEGMAMGRPVITTNAPGCRETVREGENGYLVPVRDPEALAQAMARFLEAPDRIVEMGHRSRAYAEENFDVRAVNAAMLSAMQLHRP